MKSVFIAVLAMLSVASALPVEQQPSSTELDVRQFGATENDLKDGKCAGNVFIFARGSTEVGNMVSPNHLIRQGCSLCGG